MIVRKLKVDAAWHCEVLGHIYYDDDQSELGETMAEIVKGDIVIDCGWQPEGDNNGQYCVAVCRGLERLMADYKTPDIEDAARYMEKVAKKLFAGEQI